MTISEVLYIFNELHDPGLSTDEYECGKEIDVVIIHSKVYVLTDDEEVNKIDLFHDLAISNDISGEVKVYDDKISHIEECNFQLDNDQNVKIKRGIRNIA